MSSSSDSTNRQNTQAPSGYTLEAIQEAIKSIRYGTVQLIIQDGKIVQIDKTEKIRLTGGQS